MCCCRFFTDTKLRYKCEKEKKTHTQHTTGCNCVVSFTVYDITVLIVYTIGHSLRFASTIYITLIYWIVSGLFFILVSSPYYYYYNYICMCNCRYNRNRRHLDWSRFLFSVWIVFLFRVWFCFSLISYRNIHNINICILHYICLYMPSYIIVDHKMSERIVLPFSFVFHDFWYSISVWLMPLQICTRS